MVRFEEHMTELGLKSEGWRKGGTRPADGVDGLRSLWRYSCGN